MSLRLRCHLRFKLAVGHACSNLRFRTDGRNRLDHLPFQVARDAIAAPQRRFRTEHAQDSFYALKTLLRRLQISRGLRGETTLDIAPLIPPNEQFASWIVRLQ